MSKYNDTILTAEGTRLATLAANGKTHYVITRAVATGDDLSDLTDGQLAALTKLPNEVQEGSIVEQVDDPSGSDGVIGTRVQFMNQGLSKSYSMNALGVYVKEDGHDQEVLFSVMTAESQHAQYMPDFADKVVLRFGITIFVIVGDKANVTVKLDPDGLATIKFVEDAIARIPKPDMTEYYSKKESDDLLSKKVADNGDDSMNLNGKRIMPANDANMFHRSPDTGAVAESGNFPGLQVKGVSVATSDDLKSIEASAWRPLTLENSQHGVILFKDNGDGTASLTGSATFIIGKGKATFFPIIIPPVGYTFTSLKWTKSNDGNSVYAVSGMTGSSSGTTTVVTAGLSNGNICFGGGIDESYAVTFSPSELTTLSSGINCNPALVSISKV